MVWFRTRLTVLYEEISQKKRKNGKDKLKSKMVNVTISFSEMFGKKLKWSKRSVLVGRKDVGSNPTLPSGHPLSFSPYEGMGSWM